MNWLLSGFQNADTPLGSVDLLLSERQPVPYVLPDGRAVEVEEATSDAIEAAYDAWLDRCEGDPHNVAMLYFCGHGVRIQGDRILLASDYGASRRRPFATAVNIERTLRSLKRSRIGVQCVFVDACSNTPVDAGDIEEAGARTLGGHSTFTSREPPGIILFASAPGASAYAGPARVSRFTGALVGCLEGRGYAYPEEGGRWVITNTSLINAVYRVIAKLNDSGDGPEQEPRGEPLGTVRIQIRDTPPVVPVVVQFDPDHAIGDADLVLESLRDPTWKLTRAPERTKWQPEGVTAGEYRLRAHFPRGRFVDVDKVVVALPPGPVPDLIALRAAR